MRWPRPITADHVLFDDAIDAFRTESGELATWGPPPDKRLTEYILLSFGLDEPVECGNWRILPTIREHLPGAYSAFISPIELPEGMDRHTGHQFAIAVSAVVSFATGRAVCAPRDRLHRLGETLDAFLPVMVLQFPVLTAGPGCYDTNPSSKQLARFTSNIQRATSLLEAATYADYVRLFRGMRLIQLAHNCEREDFALGYYLLVSAIESIAKRVVLRKEFVEKPLCEAEWKRAARGAEAIKHLYAAYKVLRGNAQYLKKRFVEFIMRTCPPSVWHELEHPLAAVSESLEERGQSGSAEAIVRRSPFEVYPDDLPDDLVREVLANLYDYRSNFTHEGEAPPHRQPTSSNRYFDEDREYDFQTGREKRILLPNYRLVSFIAQRSLFTYADGLLPHSAQPPGQ